MSGLTYGQTYYWKVVGNDGYQNGTSEVFSFTAEQWNPTWTWTHGSSADVETTSMSGDGILWLPPTEILSLYLAKIVQPRIYN